MDANAQGMNAAGALETIAKGEEFEFEKILTPDSERTYDFLEPMDTHLLLTQIYIEHALRFSTIDVGSKKSTFGYTLQLTDDLHYSAQALVQNSHNIVLSYQSLDDAFHVEGVDIRSGKKWTREFPQPNLHHVFPWGNINDVAVTPERTFIISGPNINIIDQNGVLVLEKKLEYDVVSAVAHPTGVFAFIADMGDKTRTLFTYDGISIKEIMEDRINGIKSADLATAGDYLFLHIPGSDNLGKYIVYRFPACDFMTWDAFEGDNIIRNRPEKSVLAKPYILFQTEDRIKVINIEDPLYSQPTRFRNRGESMQLIGNTIFLFDKEHIDLYQRTKDGFQFDKPTKRYDNPKRIEQMAELGGHLYAVDYNSILKVMGVLNTQSGKQVRGRTGPFLLSRN